MAKDKEPKAPGVNRAALVNALEGYKKPKVDTKDPNAIAERINEYLQYCVEKDLAPGVAMCANWLGVSQTTLQAWYAGSRGTPEHQQVAARFYGIIQGVWEQDMHEGNINPVSGIFIGKAFFGYKDSQEIVVQHTTSENLSIADLIAESKRLPGSDKTIDADYKVLEDNPRYEKAVERKIEQEKRKAAKEDFKVIKAEMQKVQKKEYLKKYYQEHKEEQAERDRKTRARKAERAKNANKK